MKKLNKKGFVMAETIVASSFVLTVLVILFIQFKSSINSYNRSFNYNKPENISSLGVIKRYLKNNSFNFSQTNSSPYYVSLVYNSNCTSNMSSIDGCENMVDGAGIQNLILVSTNTYKDLRNNAKNSKLPNISENMRDFIKDQNITDPDEANYRLIGEFVDGDSNKSNDPISTISFYIVPGSEVADGAVYNFDYTGSSQTFNVNAKGLYKLEIWGAQGQNWGSVPGGYGGYATGVISLNKDQKLYIAVGQRGCICNSNYNGGGSLNNGSTTPGGGGATSITSSLIGSGELKNYESSKDKIIIVAGGGGGSEWFHSPDGSILPTGGSGGGIKGNNGETGYLSATEYRESYAKGGTQTAGGDSITGFSSGKFGQGASTPSSEDGGGQGGSGYYGGGANDYAGGGAGGSGYIGSSILSEKHMTCYNCETSSDTNTKTNSTINVSGTAISDNAKIGNGYARITYLGDV